MRYGAGQANKEALSRIRCRTFAIKQERGEREHNKSKTTDRE